MVERGTAGRTAAALAVAALVVLAEPGASDAQETPETPVAATDVAASDARAVEIADRVMEAMGGRQAWDSTRYLTWNFFGRRRHVWDKWTGDVRIEGRDRETGEPYVVLMNLGTGAGRVWTGGAEVTDPEELATRLDGGEAAWINDSYWLFMPYKLEDPGVTLHYLGESPMLDGRPAEVLELTFEGVGRTPQNKYHVYVAEESGLVEQWDYYEQASDVEPRFQLPWHDWKPYGGILLSADRGENDHTDLGVLEDVPRSVFESPDPVDWGALGLPGDQSGSGS